MPSVAAIHEVKPAASAYFLCSFLQAPSTGFSTIPFFLLPSSHLLISQTQYFSIFYNTVHGEVILPLTRTSFGKLSIMVIT